MEHDFGGNKVAYWNTGEKLLRFADGPYFYALQRLEAGESLSVRDLGSFTIFLLSAPQGAALNVEQSSITLLSGDALQVEQQQVRVTPTAAITVLVAGVKNAVKPRELKLTKAADLKKVAKPWGHELWINGEHPGYALKQIYIRGPHKTSLQYHNYKQETNVLFEGHARLHYKANRDADNDTVSAADIASEALQPLSSISVTPQIIHRIEAIDDVLLYEVSTPHLDDVIRIADDSARPDGRIESEHRV